MPHAGQKCQVPLCTQSWTGGCSERTEVNPEGSVGGGCQLTALLAAERQTLLKGNLGGETPIAATWLAICCWGMVLGHIGSVDRL